jgi:tRNA G18 (ribose-2'-O)-methylase SpoU
VKALKANGYQVYAIEQVDDSIKLPTTSYQLSAKIAIILGNEIEGVQESLLPLCDGCLEIPQFGTKHSLNVSCAAAIVIWEMFKTMKL